MAQGLTRYVVDGVPISDIHHVWADTWPFIEKAIERFPNVPTPYTEGEVLRKIMRKEMQLWIGWDTEDHRPVGALVTEITNDKRHPDKVFLSIPLVGGENWNAWGDSIWTLIKRWAVHNGCTHALGYGRRGWTRLYGFVECGTTDGGLPMFVRTLKR